MTIHSTSDRKVRLDQVADGTRCRCSETLDREQAIVSGIKRGRADVVAGNLVSTDDALAELAEAIAARP